jgi:Na+/proline symporter
LRYTAQAGQNTESFFLGGRNLPWWLAGTSMVATTFAADTPLLVTELVAQNGISGNWLWWNMLISGMLTTFLFAKMWRRAGIVTDLEIIELRFSGEEAAFLRKFKAVYLGVFLNAVVIAWVNLALMSIFQVFFNISKEEALVWVAGIMVAVALYSALSGLLGVAVTDFLQFTIAMGGCILLAFIVVGSDKIGGIEGLQQKLSPTALSFFPDISDAVPAQGLQSLSISLATFFAFLGIQWWASWYPGAEPGGGGYVAQRMMSAKTEGDALKATLLFQIAHYALRPWPWILVGLCTLVLYPDLAPADKRLGYVMAMKEFLPAGLKGLLLVAFFAAYMSTISTQLNWGASYLINDLYQRFIKPDAQGKALVKSSRIATILMMMAGLLATAMIDTLSGAFNFMIACGAGLGMVLMLRWFWWRINAWSEIAATLAPFVPISVLKFFPEVVFPYDLFIIVGFVTATWLLVTFLTPPTERKVLQAFYERIQPLGIWKEIAPAHSNAALPQQLLNWLAGTVLGYATLFFIGKVVFGDWTWACIYAGAIAVCIIWLRKRL